MCLFTLKESLRESCSQVSTLQQKERERELDRERERDRERLSSSGPQTFSELDQKIQELQDKGLIRLGRTASGGLDIQVVPVTVVEYVEVPAPTPPQPTTPTPDPPSTDQPAGSVPSPPPPGAGPPPPPGAPNGEKLA